MAGFKTQSEPIGGSRKNDRFSEAVPKGPSFRHPAQAAYRAPGATDALVAVDRHDRPAKPSSSLLERL